MYFVPYQDIFIVLFHVNKLPLLFKELSEIDC